jgi:hypothetical protein
MRRRKMQKLLTLAILAAVVLICNSSDAASRRVRATQPANGYVAQNGQAGPFARLMELERRKNAALRSAFFGR